MLGRHAVSSLNQLQELTFYPKQKQCQTRGSLITMLQTQPKHYRFKQAAAQNQPLNRIVKPASEVFLDQEMKIVTNA